MKKQVSSRGLLAALVWCVLTIPVTVVGIIGVVCESVVNLAEKFLEACCSLVGRCERRGG